MRAQTKENVAMADKLVLSHADEKQTHHLTHRDHVTVCCRMDHFFTAFLA